MQPEHLGLWPLHYRSQYATYLDTEAPTTLALRCLQAWHAVLTDILLGMFSLGGGLGESPSRVGPGRRVLSRPAEDDDEDGLSSIFISRRDWKLRVMKRVRVANEARGWRSQRS